MLDEFLCSLRRATETEEQIQKRLRNARTELEQGQSSGLFDHILVNDDLETCYQSLKVTFASSLSIHLQISMRRSFKLLRAY